MTHTPPRWGPTSEITQLLYVRTQYPFMAARATNQQDDDCNAYTYTLHYADTDEPVADDQFYTLPYEETDT